MVMKRYSLFFLFTLVSLLGAFAQQADSVQAAPQFGVIDYEGMLVLMPEYQEAQAQVDDLKRKYEAESERAEAEFQRKFAEFLEGQKDFPQNIMEKRQKELQTLLEQSVQFRQTAQKLLKEARQDYTANARRRLDAVLAQVAANHHLLFVFNNSGDHIPFVDAERVVDVEAEVLTTLGLSK